MRARTLKQCPRDDNRLSSISRCCQVRSTRIGLGRMIWSREEEEKEEEEEFTKHGVTVIYIETKMPNGCTLYTYEEEETEWVGVVVVVEREDIWYSVHSINNIRYT